MRDSSSSTLSVSFTTADQLKLAFWLLVAYLAVAIALPITPLFVTQRLGFGNTLAGVAVGVGFVATICSRAYVGRQCDRIGGKPCMMRGLLAYAGASLLCGLAAWLPLPHAAAYALLLCGRLLLGFGESQALLGALNWGIAMCGPGRSGRFMSWLGAGMYGAFALGAPLGLFLYNRVNYSAALWACVAAPLLALAVLAPRAAAEPIHHAASPVSIFSIVGTVWREGSALALQGVGFAVLGAFVSIDFLRHGWSNAGLALMLFAVGYVLVRILCSSLPDRLGGYQVSRAELAISLAGLLLLWWAPSNGAALLGAFLTGTGCSMVYPAMGVEVVRKTPPALRGSALGAFSAFYDASYMVAAPLGGLLADRYGVPSVFLFGAGAAALGLLLLLAPGRVKTVAVG